MNFPSFTKCSSCGPPVVTASKKSAVTKLRRNVASGKLAWLTKLHPRKTAEPTREVDVGFRRSKRLGARGERAVVPCSHPAQERAQGRNAPWGARVQNAFLDDPEDNSSCTSVKNGSSSAFPALSSFSFSTWHVTAGYRYRALLVFPRFSPVMIGRCPSRRGSWKRSSRTRTRPI